METTIIKTVLAPMKQAVIALEDRYGKLTAGQVVEAARDTTSPLHEWFEWDDSTAAEAYRLDQARALIRLVKIEVTIEDRPVRMVRYLRDVTVDAEDQGYINAMRVRKNSVAETVDAELSRAEASIRRAQNITTLKPEGIASDAAADIASLLRAVQDIRSTL